MSQQFSTIDYAKLIDNYNRKLSKVVDSAGSCVDPVAKERRCVEVFIMPQLLERVHTLLGFRHWYKGLRSPGLYAMRSHVVDHESPHNGQDTDMVILQGVYLTTDSRKGLDQPIRVKVSNKTIVAGSKKTMREWWVKAMLDNSELGNVVSLSSLFRKATCTLPQQILFESERFGEGFESSFINDVVTLIESSSLGEWLFSSSVKLFRSKHYRPCLLELHIKYYAAREDMRAYYVDQCKERSLLGSMLQAVLIPTLVDRPLLPTEDILPAKDRNILDWKLVVQKHHDTMIILGDVSSFSSSNVNSWVYAFVVLLCVTSKQLEHLDKLLVFEVDGACVEAKISQILFLYLYLVICAPARYQGEEFYTMGGYLGVSGNMILTTSSFALFLKGFQVLADRRGIQCVSQIGGDDFAIALVGPREEITRFKDELFESMELYVGKLKEPSFSYLPDVFYNNLDVGTFCKKSVVAKGYRDPRTQCLNLEIRSVPGLPVMEILLSNDRFNARGKEIQIQFRQFVSSVRSETRKLDCSWEAETYMRLLYVSGSNMNPWKDTQKLLKQVDLGLCFRLGPFALTFEAYLKVLQVPTITDSQNRSYRVKPETKLMYLIVRNSVEIVDCLEGHDLVPLVVLPRQVPRYRGVYLDSVFLPSGAVRDQDVIHATNLIKSIGELPS